ncbi:unnamed protein product [Adineta steineri]|uniref:F-box domain-containing protein n=1 Tax=Adineta steineri TaxID=433720 RepID=A0A819FK84_9BILA|nr:unnamed protein product [Adineta steineri]
MNSSKIIILEDLPVEMLMEIFIYFTADQIYFSFSQLNNSFNLIIKSLPKLILVIHGHFDPSVLSFFNSFNKILYKFCGSRMCCGRCQSHSINGGNRLYEIYPEIDHGWYPKFHEDRFPYYPSKIDNIIHPENYSRLQSLVLPNASSKLTQLIFHGEFSRLKICHLGKCGSIILPCSMTIQLQNLRQLTIRGQQGHVLEKILLACPCLVYLDFSCRSCVPAFHFINHCFPSMKYLRLGRLKNFFFHNGQFISLLSLFPNLLQFHLIVDQCAYDVETINIHEIANYLHHKCALLKILALRIDMRGHMLRDSSIGSLKEITKMHSLFNYVEKWDPRLAISSHEVYYQYGQCAVTAKYSKKNMKLTHRIMDMLDGLSIVYWPDCQSLLNVLRNETYNIWDQDVDLSIEWPFKSNHIHSKLNNLQLFIETFQSNDFNVEYYPDRKLFSLSSVNEKSARQPHVDIWLWKRYDEHEIKPVLQLFDSSLKYQSRLMSDIYPLKSVTWLGRNVKIPRQSHKIAYKEYGISYMKPIFIRNNCRHNLIDGRWFYNR